MVRLPPLVILPYTLLMKISRDWLSDFIEWIETDPDVIADQLTRCMGEVDDVERQGQFLDGVVVGKILTLNKHPQADRLSVCTVETDEGVKNVVCGGTNLKQGMLVAFAHVGATVKAGGKEIVKLGQVKIRGVESEGMICAAEEIEITHLCPPRPEDGERPVADLARVTALNSELTAGTPLREALSMNDVIFHIDNHAITNRPDLFSHIGVARELVAMGLARWKSPRLKKKPIFPHQKSVITTVNKIPNLIPLYCSCTISVTGEGTTPEWMRRRLEATGWRSISLAVDITNYVATEIGMPLHCFDADDIQGKVYLRTSLEGESIVTLDAVKRALPAGAIILSDDRGIFDLLGIMGGLRSSTKPTSKNLYLHAAIVDPGSIRKAILGTGHRTDASTVYEKGIPLEAAQRGFLRALELILEFMPGAKITSGFESVGKEKPKKAINIPIALFSEFIGTNISTSEVKSIFKNLGFAVSVSGKNAKITPPLWRNDITMKQDLIEEVARIHRYANIPPTMPSASITPPVRDHRIHALRDGLKEAGFYELLHLAFSSPELVKKCGLDTMKTIALKNPIGEEVSIMRPSLLPAMLETLERELKVWRGSHLNMYEYGRVFEKGKPEKLELTMLVATKGATSLPESATLQAKDVALTLLKNNGYDVRLERTDGAGLAFGHPGRSALMTCQGKAIGIITELHPTVMEAMHIKDRVGIVTIDLTVLLSLSPETLIVGALPVFPSIEFDETLNIGATPHQELMKKARAVDPLLRRTSVLHLYEKDGVQNITIRFEYRSDERTLTQEEAEKIHAKVRATL